MSRAALLLAVLLLAAAAAAFSLIKGRGVCSPLLNATRSVTICVPVPINASAYIAATVRNVNSPLGFTGIYLEYSYHYNATDPRWKYLPVQPDGSPAIFWNATAAPYIIVPPKYAYYMGSGHNLTRSYTFSGCGGTWTIYSSEGALAIRTSGDLWAVDLTKCTAYLVASPNWGYYYRTVVSGFAYLVVDWLDSNMNIESSLWGSAAMAIERRYIGSGEDYVRALVNNPRSGWQTPVNATLVRYFYSPGIGYGAVVSNPKVYPYYFGFGYGYFYLSSLPARSYGSPYKMMLMFWPANNVYSAYGTSAVAYGQFYVWNPQRAEAVDYVALIDASYSTTLIGFSTPPCTVLKSINSYGIGGAVVLSNTGTYTLAIHRPNPTIYFYNNSTDTVLVHVLSGSTIFDAAVVPPGGQAILSQPYSSITLSIYVVRNATYCPFAASASVYSNYAVVWNGRTVSARPLTPQEQTNMTQYAQLMQQLMQAVSNITRSILQSVFNTTALGNSTYKLPNGTVVKYPGSESAKLLAQSNVESIKIALSIMKLSVVGAAGPAGGFPALPAGGLSASIAAAAAAGLGIAWAASQRNIKLAMALAGAAVLLSAVFLTAVAGSVGSALIAVGAALLALAAAWKTAED
jgi:hypothetical protein